MTKKLIIKKAIAEVIQRSTGFFNSGHCREGCRVLNYHSTPESFDAGDSFQMSAPKDVFLAQMQYLYENKYSVISSEELVEKILKREAIAPKTVAITFDDGFKNNRTVAFPILQKFSFKATIFLATDLVGKNADYLDWDDVSYLAGTGLISFGAHSLTHRKLASLNRPELEKEIGGSKAILERFLKEPVRIFAYPFGSYGSFTGVAIDVLRSQGYKAAFTTIIGRNTVQTDPYLLKRTRISWVDDANEFAKEMCGAYDWYGLWQRLIRTPL